MGLSANAFPFLGSVTSGALSGAPTGTTSAVTSTTGNYYLIAVYTTTAGVTVSGITSTNGITFTQLGANMNGNQLAVYGGWCTAGASGTITVTWSGTCTSNFALGVVNAITAFDPGVVRQCVAASGTTVTLASLVRSDLVCVAYGTGGTPGVTGHTIVNSSGGVGLYYAYPGTTSPTSADPSPSNNSMIGIEFPAFAGDASGTAPTLNSLQMMGMGV